MKLFKDTWVKNVKPEEKRKVYREGNGFCLYVNPTGAKIFYYVYRQGGKIKQYKIGSYPAIKLTDARAKAVELQQARERGENPNNVGVTIEQLFKKFLKEHVAKNNTVRVKKQRETQFKTHIKPYGTIPAKDFSRKDAQEILYKYKKSSQATAHNHLKGFMSSCLSWATENGYLEYNVCSGIKNMPTKSKQRILTKEEIAEVFRDTTSGGAALQLILLAGQRPGEVLNISEDDIDGHWWTVEQRKGNKTTVKRVYLTSEALKLIPRVKPYKHHSGLSQYVSRKYGQGWSPHDCRRTAGSILAEHYPAELVHRFLGHSVNKMTETYLVYKYDKELREMAQTLTKSLM